VLRGNSILIYAKASSYALIAYAVAEVVGHFWIIKPASPEEIRLLQQMSTFHRNFVGGSMSPKEIQDGLNLCYGLLLTYTGVINLIILYSISTQAKILERLMLFTTVMLLTASLISFVYFFWLPVTLFSATSAGFFITYARLKSVK
jgi:hypothetical protein